MMETQAPVPAPYKKRFSFDFPLPVVEPTEWLKPVDPPPPETLTIWVEQVVIGGNENAARCMATQAAIGHWRSLLSNIGFEAN